LFSLTILHFITLHRILDSLGRERKTVEKKMRKF
jgi:hypothetical protein